MRRYIAFTILALGATMLLAQPVLAPGQLASRTVEWRGTVTDAGQLVSLVRHNPGDPSPRQSAALKVCNFDLTDDVYVNTANPTSANAVDITGAYTDLIVGADSCESIAGHSAHTVALKMASGLSASVSVRSEFVP